MSRREVLPGSTGVDLRRSPLGAPLKSEFKRGFVYSDGWVDDARLVLLCAIDARERGATVLTRTRCERAQRGATGWTATLRRSDGSTRTVRSRALVNAAGPWAEAFLRGVARPASGEVLATRSLRLVKGSHIVVPRCFDHDHAYIFQNPDKRIIFAIPFEHDFTLIGTTDVELPGDPAAAAISADETNYLCQQASRYFRRALRPADVVWSYAGVRPLLDDASGDPSAVTRDYLLEGNTTAAPLLSVWGGKITTFRKLAEEAADEVGRLLGEQRTAWTATATLPGGDIGDFERFVQALQRRHAWLAPAMTRRLARAYGSRAEGLLAGATGLADLGEQIAPGLFEAELRHLQNDEWALSADDVLWRRSKLGLHYDAARRAAVAAWLQAGANASPAIGRQTKAATCN
jgi:glycerol-3-phosphate dehydrogenase